MWFRGLPKQSILGCGLIFEKLRLLETQLADSPHTLYLAVASEAPHPSLTTSAPTIQHQDVQHGRHTPTGIQGLHAHLRLGGGCRV